MKVNDPNLVGGKPQSGQLEIKVIRANGKIEDHGIVSEYHPNPIKNWWLNRKRKEEHKRRMEEYDSN